MSVRFAFAGGAIPRRAEIRSDPEQVAGLFARSDTRILPVWRGKPLRLADARLCWLPAGHSIFSGSSAPVLAGMPPDGPRFAASVPDWFPAGGQDVVPDSILDLTKQTHPEAPEGAEFVSLRSFMTGISADEAELAAVAKTLLDWHATHQHCPRCGTLTEMTHAGWQRRCGDCRTDHFCRTDPVVIMLVTHRNSVLVGRSRGWPRGMHSLLAGFIEPGETVEAAVCRETFEEAGVTVTNVRYLASQPWPFPASLMIGCSAQAVDTALRIDHDELENVLWVRRERMAEIFAGRDSSVRPPRQGSIAEHMIMMWLQGRTGAV